MSRAASFRGVALAACLAECAVALRAYAAPPPPSHGAAAAKADASAEQLQEAEKARAALLAAQQEATSRLQAAQIKERQLGQQRATAAARLRAREEETAAIAGRVAELATRTRDAQIRLDARAHDLAPLLPLIERLSRYPSETLLAVPLPPERTLRGVLVLGFMIRQLQAEAASLRREQADIATLRLNLDIAARQLTAAQAAQAAEAAVLDDQIAAARGQQREAEDAATEAARRGAEEASRADGLRAAIARIDAEQRAAEASAREEAALATRQRRDADAARARQRQEALARPAGPGVTSIGSAPPNGAATRSIAGGPEPSHVKEDALVASAGASGNARAARLTAPVAGSVVRSFGEAGDGGPASGLSYAAPPAARVVSPCGGRVVFSGPFRSFGQLMIVDCGASDLFVLAGLARLDAHVGQAVQPGEPVGVMPDWDPRSAAARPSLYVELRHAGQPVNPAPFLRARG